MKAKPFTLDRIVRLLIGLTVIVLLFFMVKRLSDALLPFLIAWFIAYLLQPVVRFFQYKLRLKSRVLSVTCTLLLFLGSLCSVIWLLIPLVINEMTKLSQLVVVYSQRINMKSFLPVAWQNEILNYLSHLNFQRVLHDENIMSGIKKLAPQLWSLINGSLDFLLGFAVVIIVFLYLIFILLDYERITAGWFYIIPPKYRGIVAEIMNDLEISMNRYFRGQALIALIVGILFSIGFSIIQLPLAIILGLSIGVLTMVPYLKVILIIPCVALGFLQSMETGQPFGSILLGIGVVFILIQTFEDVLITPKIMGRVTGLNPAVILLSLSVWGSLMGMVGMIIALPMTTLMISYYKRFVLKETGVDQIETVKLKIEDEIEKEVDL